jgi:hypothetical protein
MRDYPGTSFYHWTEFFHQKLRPLLVELRDLSEKGRSDARSLSLESEIKTILDLASLWMKLANTPDALKGLQNLGVAIKSQDLTYLWTLKKAPPVILIFESVIRNVWEIEDEREGMTLRRSRG